MRHPQCAQIGATMVARHSMQSNAAVRPSQLTVNASSDSVPQVMHTAIGLSALCLLTFCCSGGQQDLHTRELKGPNTFGGARLRRWSAHRVRHSTGPGRGLGIDGPLVVGVRPF